jgi:hypothetical protein
MRRLFPISVVVSFFSLVSYRHPGDNYLGTNPKVLFMYSNIASLLYFLYHHIGPYPNSRVVARIQAPSTAHVSMSFFTSRLQPFYLYSAYHVLWEHTGLLPAYRFLPFEVP